MPSCHQCGSPCEVTTQDRAFYDRASPVIAGRKFPIPLPTLCPHCRQQRRLSFRNERKLYTHNCDLCSTQTISVTSTDTPFTIYCGDCWWSDRWDPFEYGRDYAFRKPFFEQYYEFQRTVPRYTVLTLNCQNCDYSPWQIDCRNCYLCTGGRYNEDCLYCFFPIRSENCVDCTLPNRSKFCYECMDVLSCHGCFHSSYVDTCHNCTFCYDCIGCTNCFLCTGLRQKQCWVLNEQRTKEEYHAMLQQFDISNHQHLLSAQRKFQELMLSVPHRDMRLISCEGCSGDLIKNSRNVRESYNVESCEDCAFLYDIRDAKDSRDLYIGGFDDELCYEGLSVLNSLRSCFCTYCWDGNHDLLYCDSCFASRHLFGCIGLKHREYCILNKQYAKEEYEELLSKIIEQMTSTGEYGEFFPIPLSPFAYNETVASEYFPLPREEVVARGWQWKEMRDEIPSVERVVRAEKLPSTIANISDDILNWAITCEATKRPYRIQKAELVFYRKMMLPVPRRHPDERHRQRMALRNPRRLWSRTCQKCRRGIQTTYSPERTETVLCEKCYLKEVY